MALSDFIRDIGIRIDSTLKDHPAPGNNAQALAEIEGYVELLRSESGYTDRYCDQLLVDAQIYYGPLPLPEGEETPADRFTGLRQLANHIQAFSHTLKRRGL